VLSKRQDRDPVEDSVQNRSDRSGRGRSATVSCGGCSRRRWLALYLVGALVGHAIGDVFQPLEGGTSVAFVGILGGLAAYSLVGGIPQLQRFRLQAAVAIPLAVLDTVLGDIHGLPDLAGLALATAWLVRDGSAQPLRLTFPRPRRGHDGPSARTQKLPGI
jgi:hypothetical protein